MDPPYPQRPASNPYLSAILPLRRSIGGGRLGQLDQAVEECRLRLDDPRARRLDLEPLRTVELGELAQLARARRPLHLERSALDLGHVHVAKVFGPGTIKDVTMDKSAYDIQFDDMPTERQISFRVKLQKTEKT